MTNVKNSKNSEYYEKVIKELKESCQALNEVFEYDVKQTRETFKRCIGICKDTAMKIKTASGDTRFQEDKEYGTWFNKLFNVMKSTANCQPEQSIEPDSQNYGSSSDLEEKSTNCVVIRLGAKSFSCLRLYIYYDTLGILVTE